RGPDQHLRARSCNEPEPVHGANREVDRALHGEAAGAQVLDVERQVHRDELAVRLTHDLDAGGSALDGGRLTRGQWHLPTHLETPLPPPPTQPACQHYPEP